MLCRLSVLCILCTIPRLEAFREVFQFASYYGDHMVLQQAPEQAVLWGYGTNGSKVTVTLRGNKSQKRATYVDEGIWRVALDPVKAGGPYNVTAVQEGEAMTQITLVDVLFGDVWLCGGQSNMAMTLSQVFNATEELALASKYPHVRIFTVALEQSTTELRDLPRVDVPWSVPTAGLLGNGNFTYFSAVCWLFGRYLHDTLQYPVGLVESCWGGTPVESWSSDRVLKKCGLAEKGRLPPSNFTKPLTGVGWDNSVLWNAMIHPLLNMTIKGAIWYQGEANTNYHQDNYSCTFPGMIDDWRMGFHEGSGGQTAMDFPFGFVQLSTYEYRSDSDAFPNLRWHQTADYGFAPNPRMKKTFMAVALDLPDKASPWGSIHPRNKQDVAFRLTLGARAVAYQETAVSFQGPLHQKILRAGNLLNVTYAQKVSVVQSISIFEICCSEKGEPCDSRSNWVPAPTEWWGQSYILLSTALCNYNVAGVRYAWKDWPCDAKACPVYSEDGVLPAPPFIADLS